MAHGRAFALRLPALGEAILFVEIESGGVDLTGGFWLSVDDQAWAATWRADVEAHFGRVMTPPDRR